MRNFTSIIIPALLVSVSHLVYAQDCDLVQEQACCYAEIDNGSDTSYCCNGSIVGNPSSSGASALNDLTCCQDDGRTGISVGFDITTCRAGSATPLTAKGTAASTVADVIKSLSVSRSMSRESLYSSASVSRASATAATASSTGGSSTTASSAMSTVSSSSVSSSASSSSSSSSSAAGITTTSSSSSGSGTAVGATSSSTSTGGAALMSMDAWNAVVAGGFVLAAAAL